MATFHGDFHPKKSKKVDNKITSRIQIQAHPRNLTWIPKTTTLRGATFSKPSTPLHDTLVIAPPPNTFQTCSYRFYYQLSSITSLPSARSWLPCTASSPRASSQVSSRETCRMSIPPGCRFFAVKPGTLWPGCSIWQTQMQFLKPSGPGVPSGTRNQSLSTTYLVHVFFTGIFRMPLSIQKSIRGPNLRITSPFLYAAHFGFVRRVSQAG